jgi:hypothetical protein
MGGAPYKPEAKCGPAAPGNCSSAGVAQRTGPLEGPVRVLSVVTG